MFEDETRDRASKRETLKVQRERRAAWILHLSCEGDDGDDKKAKSRQENGGRRRDYIDFSSVVARPKLKVRKVWSDQETRENAQAQQSSFPKPVRQWHTSHGFLGATLSLNRTSWSTTTSRLWDDAPPPSSSPSRFPTVKPSEHRSEHNLENKILLAHGWSASLNAPLGLTSPRWGREAREPSGLLEVC